MGKRRRPKSRNNWAKSITLLICAVLGAFYAWFGAKSNPVPVPEGCLEVHFIDVGQGDATLIRCGEEAMLIDGGTEYSGTRVQLYLKKLGITRLKYVVGTHPDADHIGGLATVLYNFETETVLMTDREAKTKVYDNLMGTMRDRGYTKTLPMPGTVYELGEGRFTVLGPLEEAKDSNNESIALRFEFGETSFLFCGDAEREEEETLIHSMRTLRSTVYKVSHHGSNSSSSSAFLLGVRPRYAVISCGADNDYGHPHAEAIERLQKMDATIFRTDEAGTIWAVSDGREITWSTEKEPQH